MSKMFTKPFRPLDWAATPKDFTKDNGNHQLQLGPHTVEEIQRYVYGTRFLMWNGQVYKYANAEGAVLSYRGSGRVVGSSVCSEIVDAPVASQIGDRSITWTTKGANRAEDDLAGGLAFIYDKSETDVTLRRNIVGNEASVGATTVLHLDYPLEIALEITTPDAMEIFENIYGDTEETGYNHTPWLGVPNRGCAAGYKYWLQTWGPCVVSAGELNAVIDRAAGERGLIWEGGTLHNESDNSAAGLQQAGYHLTVGQSSYGPLFMLMCST